MREPAANQQVSTSPIRRRVLYFSIGTFAPTPYVLGGNIFGKNLVERLAQDDGIQLFALNANHELHREATIAFFAHLSVPVMFVPMRPTEELVSNLGDWDRLIYRVKAAFRFPYELEAYKQTQIMRAAAEAIRAWDIQHVLVDFLPATLFWAGIQRLRIPKALVTVNREADLYKDILSLGLYVHNGWRAKVSHWRLKRYERLTYNAFDKVIAIGHPDRPTSLPSSRTAVITPYLDPNATRWSHGRAKTVFFVGNIGHYPNRLAISHIVSELAPRVRELDPDIKFAVIGASAEQVDPAYRHQSVELLGTSTPQEVDRLFRTAALFICPVENTFGMKFKVAEAISYGTPFLASEQTMLGFPYLRDLPALDLRDAGRSAGMIVDLVSSPDRLAQLSAEICRRHDAFARSQRNIWSRMLFGDVAA